MIITGKIAIVTGASSGIGKATAELLSQKGARVVSVSRHGPFIADMTKAADISRMVDYTIKHYGRVDILVNNAGRGYDAAVEYIDTKTLHEIFELDVMGPIIAMQKVIPIMRSQGSGVIVNVSSGTALMNLPNMSPYAAMKKALAGISIAAYAELAKDHISVSVIYPYSTNTDFEKHTIKGKEIRVAWGGKWDPPKIDEPDYVAQKILEAIETGKPEIFAHDWMKKLR